MFNIAIIGGENTNNYKFFQEKCINLLRNKAKSGEGIRILTIGDDYVDAFANRFSIETKTYYCDWNTLGKEALKDRNRRIINDCDAVLYFDTGKRDLNYLFQYAIYKNKINRHVILPQEIINL